MTDVVVGEDGPEQFTIQKLSYSLPFTDEMIAVARAEPLGNAQVPRAPRHPRSLVYRSARGMG